MSDAQATLTYKQVIELGFERVDEYDRVFEEQHGYRYFYVEKNFPKKVSVGWDIHTHKLKLYKSGDLVREITPQELSFLIILFS